MKIVVLTKNYGLGFTGATTSTYKLIQKWQTSGIDVEVIALNVRGKVNKNVVIRPFKEALASCFFGKKKHDDEIGYSDDHLGWLLRLVGIKYIHTYHGNWPGAAKISIPMFFKSVFFIPMYLLTFALSEGVGTVSEVATSFIRFGQNNIFVARNGVDVEAVPIKSGKDFSGLNTLKILMVGNVDSRKFGDAVNLWEKFVGEVDEQKISVSVYGKTLNKELMSELTKTGLVSEMGFHNKIPYEEFDLFVSVSKSENLSIAETEAIVSGVPVLAYDVGGTDELVKEGLTGWLFEVGDLNGMYNTISLIKRANNLFFDNTSVIRNFSWDLTAAIYLENFEKIRQGECN